MAATTPHAKTRTLTWRVAGLWMVVLAIGLAVLGVVLSFSHAQSLMNILMVQVGDRATLIANHARGSFNRQLSSALVSASDYVHNQAPPKWQPPKDWPTWADGIYTWDGSQIQTIVPADDAPAKLEDLMASKFAVRSFENPPEVTPQGTELLYDTLAGTKIVLAYHRTIGANSQKLAVVVRIVLPKLRKDLIEPLISHATGLMLVRSDGAATRWSQQMLGAMKFWTIKPTAEYIKELRRTVFGQTMFDLGLTGFALVTLLGAMWILVRLARKELDLAQMKSDFVADVSHELKTPLAVIRMYSETLQSGRIATDEKRQDYYDIITRESTRLTNLINNILDFARIETGRQVYEFLPINMGQVAEETYAAYGEQLERAGFSHSLEIEDNLPLIMADRDAMTQVLINLISNAVKYSTSERFLLIELTTEVRRGRHGVLIALHDHGIGIRPEDRAKLMDGFFRASDSRVRRQRGTGLGLALVKQIVDAHQGILDVESRLVKGSTFRIFLPQADGEPEDAEMSDRNDEYSQQSTESNE